MNRFANLEERVWNSGKTKAAGIITAAFDNIVAAHTGQSSQLFPDATGRNAWFLASCERRSTLT
jgi:hypothetical protein